MLPRIAGLVVSVLAGFPEPVDLWDCSEREASRGQASDRSAAATEASAWLTLGVAAFHSIGWSDARTRSSTGVRIDLRLRLPDLSDLLEMLSSPSSTGAPLFNPWVNERRERCAALGTISRMADTSRIADASSDPIGERAWWERVLALGCFERAL